MKTLRVVAAAVIEQGRVLCARRGPSQSQAGLWEFPGGKVEPAEDDRQALARELNEELAIEVAVHAYLDENIHSYPAIRIQLVAYACTLLTGEPVASEHDALRWCTAADLDTLEWAPADIPLLPAVKRALA